MVFQKLLIHYRINSVISLFIKVDNFEITEYILSELFSEKMQLNTEDHPLLMVEPPMQNKDNRNKLVEILFENFGFKGAFF